MRIPANGFLAATLLGIATVALHTRVAPHDSTLLSTERVFALSPRRARVALGLALLLCVVVIVSVARGAVVDWRVAAYRAAPTRERAEAIVAVDGADPRGLAARGLERLRDSAATSLRPDGAPRARVLVDGAIADLRAALRAMPAEPTYHERLGAAYAARALSSGSRDDAARALAHHRRAVAASPENATLYVSLFRFALSQRPASLGLALDAARGGIARDPAVLDRVLDAVAPLALKDGEWTALVPAATAPRLRLALALETRALLRPATAAARSALETPANRVESAAARWLLARLLILEGNAEDAVQEISLALLQDAANPELTFTYAEALRARGDPRALDAYRAAATAAPHAPRDAFLVADGPLRDAIRARVGDSPLRYRKALAWYLGARGYHDQALREWRAIVDADGKDAQARFALAAALEARGQADRALEEYREAVGARRAARVSRGTSGRAISTSRRSPNGARSATSGRRISTRDSRSPARS